MRKTQGLSVYRRAVGLLSPGTEIREGNLEDFKKFQAWLNPFEAEVPIINSPHVTHFVAEKGERIIGFVQLIRHLVRKHSFFEYWLYSLTVKPIYRRMGIGKKLSLAAIERAKEEGARELFLLVGEDNERAIKLYRRLGFEMKVNLEPMANLEEGKRSLGRRRVTMSKRLAE